MKHIAIIFGGPSAEHEVSLVSAKNIFQALSDTSLEISLIGITKNGIWKRVQKEDLLKTSFQTPLNLDVDSEDLFWNEDKISLLKTNKLQETGPIDMIFPIIHGTFGEDGGIQRELNQRGLPFVGSDEEACFLTFDKGLTKQAIESTSVVQAPYIILDNKNLEYADVVEQLGSPFFVKPANMGSSLGIHKVKNAQGYETALQDARTFDSKIVIEKGLTAREVECAILEVGDEVRASGIGEIKPNHEFYSYEAKYLDPKGADLIIPANVSEDMAKKIQQVSIEIFRKLKCRDFARVDFFLSETGELFFNEVNTFPGFTNISQFPMLWQEQGMSYRELILHLLEQAKNH